MISSDLAGRLRRLDPDRYLAAMAAPQESRGALLAIYALNAEIAQAAWCSAEPLMCQMRLQWWSDRLAEIVATGRSSGHPLLPHLADILDGEGAGILGDVVGARHWDTERAPFAGSAEFKRHLQNIGGSLNWAAARAIGAVSGEAAIRQLGEADAMANFFLAVPKLHSKGRLPLVDPSESGLRELAQGGLLAIKRARKLVPQIARPATRAGWRTTKTLRLVAANPAAVASGRLHSSEFSRRASLLIRVLGRSA